MIRFDTHEVDELVIDLPKLGIKGAKVMDTVLEQGSKDLRDKWAENAKETSGKHARFYPKSIDVTRVLSTDIVFEVGPNDDKPQGFLGYILEYGGSHSPAHLDGQRAADEILPVIQGRATTALFHMFGLDS